MCRFVFALRNIALFALRARGGATGRTPRLRKDYPRNERTKRRPLFPPWNRSSSGKGEGLRYFTGVEMRTWNAKLQCGRAVSVSPTGCSRSTCPWHISDDRSIIGTLSPHNSDAVRLVPYRRCNPLLSTAGREALRRTCPEFCICSRRALL